MNSRLIMTYLYPSLAAASFTLVILAILFWLTKRRTRLVLTQSIYFVTEFATFVLLTLTTGAHPMIDIDHFRSWIVVSRLCMLVAMLCYGAEYLRRVKES